LNPVQLFLYLVAIALGMIPIGLSLTVLYVVWLAVLGWIKKEGQVNE
jgi:hypothetical protein